jgi:hypothetical protein
MESVSSFETPAYWRGEMAKRAERKEWGRVSDHGVAPSKPLGADTSPANPNDPEFVSIPVWCRRVDCSRDTGYRLARRGDIPGQFRIGTLLRVNWDVFVRSTESAERSEWPTDRLQRTDPRC